MKRPTIGDIARRAGLSKAAVSYALNGRPGVSEETRDRVSRIAHALGWRANTAALALSGERAGAVGLAITGPISWAVVAGIERELAGDGIALLLAIADGTNAEETYQDWWATRRVDGVLVVDPRPEDHRIPFLHNLNVPTVVIGDGRPGMSSLRIDPEPAYRKVIEHLTERGHQTIGHVGERKFGGAQVLHAQGEPLEAIRRLREEVTAVVFDDPLDAVKVVAHAAVLNMRIPDDLAIVAYGDVPVCELTHPGITAIRHDEAAQGAAAARLLLNQLRTGVAEQDVIGTHELIVRGTT
ncbi:DNA-binding LacI/PurR family transcriptional regulator [Kibdelosporangium banguiense]|uniref:DNA-binding LacI/PurR family transcriptional regulator n=1 Tax=Kibdelosporangium banguiense TaxID=1365924 RepID=A0ABS4TB29_9PSEU|nr:LacI family DNA-binding transcriptional regulator [Kibdelosporangium banguiense]MBP2321056.1 DNA-binding LacI/PurR family transcriptional regulator [Kibdelosporangium banguiense]